MNYCTHATGVVLVRGDASWRGAWMVQAHGTADVIFRDDAACVLLLETTYGAETREIPGGGNEANESPWQCARQEIPMSSGSRVCPVGAGPGRRSTGYITPIGAILLAGARRPGEQCSEGGSPTSVLAQQTRQCLENWESKFQDPLVLGAGLNQPAEEPDRQGHRGQSHYGSEGAQSQRACDVRVNRT